MMIDEDDESYPYNLNNMPIVPNRLRTMHVHYTV